MMTKAIRNNAERMVPVRLLSNLMLFVKKIRPGMMSRTKFRRAKITAPTMPGMPPSPSGQGASSGPEAVACAVWTAPLTLPFLVMWAIFFSTVPGLWIIFHSSVASLPTYAMMAASPPGWMGIHFVTSMASPKRMIHASSFVLCLATSSILMPPASAGAAAAAPPPPPAPTFPIFVTCARFFSTVPGLWIICHSSVASWPK
mmetsp:Transcript_1190/g.3607  ORF Transcript_1190/g.3607 Transcript_1190/m.3607 type:complete len:201 (-) Transcript_1190:1748-2350(-)